MFWANGASFYYLHLGLLAAIAFFFASYMLNDFPLTGNLGTWYWGSSLYALTVVAAIGVFGYYSSTTGQAINETAQNQRMQCRWSSRNPMDDSLAATQ